MDDREPTSMLRAAVRPRMLVMLVLLLAAAAVCARLGVWQLDRAQLSAQPDAPAEGAEARGPVPLGDVLRPQTSFRADLAGRHVAVTGTYEADGQLLVTGREVDGRPVSLVLTPLRVTSGGGPAGGAAAGAVLPVVRGWVDAPDAAALEMTAMEVPAGEVAVTGYLQASEASGALDATAGTTDAVSSAQLVNVWGGPIYAGYLALAGSDPGQPVGLTPLPAPDPDADEGWDLRNLGYAAQWWIFALFAMGLWLRLVRDEAQGEPRPGEGDLPTEPVVRPLVEPSVEPLAVAEGPAAVRSSGGVDAAP